MVGSTLNHYRVLKPLGSGGMGDVFLAEDTRLKRMVALKILPTALSAQPERLDRFEREAQVVAALNHPNIVTVFSVEQAGDAHFLTMEFVDGKTLSEMLPKSGLSLKRLLAIARQVVDAVIAAHDRGIIHRDLKPANVMVTANDRVKVLDFGLAKLREEAGSITASMPTRELTGEGKIVGTVAYMSPEQAEGKTIDGRSDVFSLGVVLYELATGARPFDGDTSLSVLTSILRDTPRPLTEINPAIPRELGRIVRHCLAKEPDRRYQSAKDLRNDLDELEQSLASGEIDAPAAMPVARSTGRNWMWIVGGVAIGALVVAALWSLRGLSNRPPPAIQASHSQLTVAPGVENFPSVSPDGKWVVYSKSGDILLQSVTGQTTINLTRDSAGNTMPAFSPDGESIAFRSERDGGGIFVMGRTGESVRRVATRGFAPAWFPDGRKLVFAGNGTPGPESISTVESDLSVVDVGGGDARPLVSGYYATQPRVSPHGLRVAYWAVRSDLKTDRYNRDIWTVDANGANPQRATTDPANDWNPVWSPDGRWLYFISNRSGSMNLWRVAIDESSGRTSGEPQPITAPAPYVAHFSLSADGRIATYAAALNTGNMAQVDFDTRTGAVVGQVTAITTGARDFFGGYLDVTRDGRFLAATTFRGQEDVYLVSTSDGSIRQLTNDASRDRAPRWSPDGRHVLFYSDRGGNYNVWSIDPDGSGLRQLTKGAWRGYPVSSPDGSRMVTDDLEAHRLFIYDTRDFDKAPEQLPPNPDPAVANLLTTDWSPDGQRILYGSPATTRGGVWMYSLPDRTHRRLTDGNGGAWLRNGQQFIYSDRGALHLYDTRSNAHREVLAIAGESLGGARFAVDDSKLFFLRSVVEGDIWLVRFSESPSR